MLYISILLHFMFNIFIAIVIVLITFKPTATASNRFALLLVSLFNFPMSCTFFLGDSFSFLSEGIFTLKTLLLKKIQTWRKVERKMT